MYSCLSKKSEVLAAENLGRLAIQIICLTAPRYPSCLYFCHHTFMRHAACPQVDSERYLPWQTTRSLSQQRKRPEHRLLAIWRLRKQSTQAADLTAWQELWSSARACSCGRRPGSRAAAAASGMTDPVHTCIHVSVSCEQRKTAVKKARKA